MSDAQQPLQAAAEQGTYQAGAGLVVVKQPDEVAIPLRRDEFQTLCEGAISESRASRDLCIGILLGTLAGLAGVVATADWTSVLAPGHRFWFLLSMLILTVLASGSGVGMVIFWMRCSRTATDSPYSRLKQKLLKLYQQRQE